MVMRYIILASYPTFILKSPDYISPPVLQLQPGVLHSLIFWDVANMQNTTIETLLIHVSLGGSETNILAKDVNICNFSPSV